MNEPRKLPGARFVAIIPPGYSAGAFAPAGLVVTGIDKPVLVWDGAKWAYLKAEPQSPRPAPGNTDH